MFKRFKRFNLAEAAHQWFDGHHCQVRSQTVSKFVFMYTRLFYSYNHITSYHIISHYIISIRNHTWYIHTHTLCRNPNKNWDTPFPARSQEPSIAGMLSCRKSLESLAMKCGRANHGPPPLGQPGRDHSGSCWASQSSKVLKALSKIFKTKNIS